MRALMVALAAGIALAGCVTPAQAAPKQVLVVGDSVTGGASNYINFFMGASDGSVATTVKSVGGHAICDILPGGGGPWTINSLLAERRYDAVVVAHTGNAVSPCMGGRTGQAVVDKYWADANTLASITTAAGVPRTVFVEPPAAREAARDYVRTKIGMDVYRTMQARFPTARSVDGGVRLEAYGKWAQFLPCESWDVGKPYGCDGYANVPIGAEDGIHLFCAVPGATTYGVVQPCQVNSPANTRYGMNVAQARSFIGL